jgi:hypothetical protein
MPQRFPADIYVPQSARDLIAQRFGVAIPIAPRESTVTVGTSVVAIGKFARQRVAVSFVNQSSGTITLGMNNAVTTTSGFQLTQGQFLTFQWELDGELVMQDFWAIGSAGGLVLYVLESVLTGVP